MATQTHVLQRSFKCHSKVEYHENQLGKISLQKNKNSPGKERNKDLLKALLKYINAESKIFSLSVR